MNQSFFIGALGAHQQQKSLAVTSNNIANVNAHGFKAGKSRFVQLMYENLRSAEGGDVKSGLGTCVWTTDTNFAPGPGAYTGYSQDYMIEGNGFFALVDLNTNEISFTRSGNFCMASMQRPVGILDENGQPVMETVYYLSDGNGRFVLGENGGMIEMDDPNEKQPVGIFDYINYNGMEHRDGIRFLPVEKNGNLTLASGKLIQGYLEGSNVDLADEMTKVIETQRSYSMALKMMTTSDEIESTINSLRG